MAIYFPNFTETGDADVIKKVSWREGGIGGVNANLGGIVLCNVNCGGIVMAEVVGVGNGVLDDGMLGGVEIDSDDVLEVD